MSLGYAELSELQGGARPWQSVQSVKKAFISETMSATLIEDPIKSGNQTLKKLAANSTEFLRNYMFVLPV